MPPLIESMQQTVSTVCTSGLAMFIVFAFTFGVLQLLAEAIDP